MAPAVLPHYAVNRGCAEDQVGKGGKGQEVGAAVVLCAMELVGFRENGLIH